MATATVASKGLAFSTPRSSFSPSSPPGTRSPDTASPLYPARPIRPLPRRRLQSRLSPDEAGAIVYPPLSPSSSGDAYSLAQQESEERRRGGNRNQHADPVGGIAGVGETADGGGAVAHVGHLHAHAGARGVDRGHPDGTARLQHQHQNQQPHHHCTCGDDADSGEEEVEFDHPDYRYNPPGGAVSSSNAQSTTNGGLGPSPAAAAAATSSTSIDRVQARILAAAKAGMHPGRAGKAGLSLPPVVPSTATSSADGYESFENNSNKKKRKIPLSSGGSVATSATASAAAVGMGQVNAGMASMGLNGDEREEATLLQARQREHQYQQAAAGMAVSGTGISGAGRGRYGRQSANSGLKSERRSLGSGAVGVGNSYRSATVSGRNDGLGVDANVIANGAPTSPPLDPENTTTGGIISQAIRSAAERGPLTPATHEGINNNGINDHKTAVSTRDRTSPSLSSNAPTTATTTPKTAFTFSCESQSAGKMAIPQPAYASPNTSGAAAAGGGVRIAQGLLNGTTGAGSVMAANRGTTNSTTQGTQTTPPLRGSNAAAPPGSNRSPLPPTNPAIANNTAHPQSQQPLPAPKPPRPRRRPSKEFALAARQRQLQQEYTNYHHRPTRTRGFYGAGDNAAGGGGGGGGPGNMWICEFCEYEDIFGVPPLALMRQYEVKDRQDRKRLAEKRRLLEKAKMKGRKGRKGAGKKGGAGKNAPPNTGLASPGVSGGVGPGGTGVGQGVNGAGGGQYIPPALPLNGELGEEDGYYDGEEEEEDEEDDDEEDDEEYEGEDGYEPDERYADPDYQQPPPAPAGTPLAGTARGGGGGGPPARR